ncbi:hypothetical protein FJZ31_35455 [Candidatus Poribacteria bacterium]|nr:hypothetical protein [Candidatus Poribacteria bacterium]
MEKNILKLMQATLGEVEFTDAVQNRISQRLNAKRQLAAMQVFTPRCTGGLGRVSEQLPLFPEIGLLEKPKPVIEAELEVANFLWDFPPMIVVPAKISSEEQVELEKLSPWQIPLPGFESLLANISCVVYEAEGCE